MPRVEGLTAKQERFVAEYLVDGNGTRAAIAAGYSERTAKGSASELLKKPKVIAALAAAKRSIFKKLELSAEKVLNDIARISAAAEKARDFGPALRGQELLGKHLKMFADKVEHSGPNGGPISVLIGQLGKSSLPVSNDDPA